MGLFGWNRTSITLTGAEIQELPVAQLARVVLRDLSRKAPDAISLTNWTNAVRLRYQSHRETLGTLAGAVAWLKHQMYVTDDYLVFQEGSWIRLSRAGRAWLAETAE